MRFSADANLNSRRSATTAKRWLDQFVPTTDPGKQSLSSLSPWFSDVLDLPEPSRPHGWLHDSSIAICEPSESMP